MDGREVYDYRNVNISIAKEFGRVEVTLGKTRCALYREVRLSCIRVLSCK